VQRAGSASENVTSARFSPLRSGVEARQYGLDLMRGRAGRAWAGFGGTWLEQPILRYAFAVAMVAIAFALRLALVPLAGTGAPYLLFFAATVASALFAGVGPGLLSVALGAPLAAHMFVVRAGYSASQASIQALLFAIDGVVIVYLTHLANRARQNTKALIDLAPDAFFLADQEARFVDVNQAACELVGYQHDELVGKTIFDIIPDEDAARLRATQAELGSTTRVHRAEWMLVRKDAQRVPVEVSSNILADGRWPAFIRDISRRKRREEALRESENRFRTLAEAVPQIVWITSPDGLVIYFNQLWVKYTGLPLEESYGHGWNTLFHPDDRQRALDAWQHALQTDTVYSIEARIRRADGIYRWWLIRGVSQHDEKGLVINWVGTCTDIDDLKRIQEALRQSEEQFRLTLDEAPIGMALVALDGRFVRVNRALCEIVGYEPSELTGRTFQSITHPDDLNADLALWAQLERGEIPRYKLEKRSFHKNGAVVDILLNVALLRGKDGAPVHYIAQIEDITERKRAEAALRESERRLNLALDAAQMGTWDLDFATDTAVRSSRHAQIFGYSSPIPHWGIATFMPHVVPEDREQVERCFERAFATDVLDMQCRILWPDRSLHWIEAKGHVYRDQRGVPTRMLGTVVDITERKQKEQALRRAVAARDQILGLVAHDLRNPLGTVLMQVSAMARRGPEPERRNQRPIEIISRAARRMNHLIRDLLDVAQLEAGGGLRIERAQVSARDLVVEAMEVQRSLVSAAQLELELDVQGDLAEVWADRNRLLQVFDNLIGNAVKFSKAGGQVTIGAATRPHEVLFFVSDTGCGISPEGQAHVFERFWQAAEHAGRLGAGLGLPITKGIVETHGGRIWVESTPGQGSTFFFTIPTRRPAEDGAKEALH
jgi:PAS domain S-box-containing protein